MIDKIMGWFSLGSKVSPGVVTRERQKRYIRGKALTVEETLLLASGENLKTIRTRKSNPVFVKLPSSTQRDRKISMQEATQPVEGLQILVYEQQQAEKLRDVSSSEKQEPEPVAVRSLTEKILEKRDEDYPRECSDLPEQKLPPSKLSSQINERSLMRESICSRAVTSCISTLEVGMSSKMSTSQLTISQCISSERLSSLPCESTCDYQKTDSPLAEHWEIIQNERMIAETKKRFFMSVPKPIIVPKISWITTVVSGCHLTLPDYYQPRKLIGRGTYAIVFEALDTRTDKIVAIKRNKGFMRSLGDTMRILRELKLWMWFQHQDICNLLDVIPILHENIFSFEDIYLVVERMDADLSRAFEMCQLTQSHCQVITYQILRSLKFIHSANVIHRDLKPENVLIQTLESNTKITDFGCSRPLGLEGSFPGVLTEYVVTRWYRSPEIYLCSHKYGKACDLWALGCILAEMYRKGKPLFQGPKCNKRQIQLIFSIVGKPTRLDWITNPSALNFVEKLREYEPKPLKVLCPGICDEGANLLSRLLEPDPRSRISVEDALAHPFVSGFRDQSSELKCKPFDITYEKDPRVKSKRGLRLMLYETINKWHERTTSTA